MQDQQKLEALQVLAEIAKQAEAAPKSRSMGSVRALIAGFPTIIGLAADVTTLWERYGPIVRTYFGF